MSNGGAALIAGLAAHGVDTIFGIPGTHNLAAYAAMPEHSIRHVLTRHEQGAGYAADGYARSSGKPCVVLTTTGPALLNAAAAAAQAYSDSVPVLFISPGMPLTHPGRGNGLLHEVKDQSRAMASIVAHSHRVTSVAEIPVAVAQAFTSMTTARPRPVHLEIPLDLFDRNEQFSIVPPVTTAVPQAAHTLIQGQKPLIIVGGGAWRAADEVIAVAEALGAPVFSTANGKGIVPEDHPLFAGAGVHHPSVREAVDASDCVLAIGTELAPSDWWSGLPDFTGKLVRIDIDPASAHTNAIATQALIGDSATILRNLVLETPTDGTERAAMLRNKHQKDAETAGRPWLDVIAAIQDSLPRNAIVAGDSTMVCYYGALSNLRSYRPRGFLYPTGGGTLGYGLPAAVGAKIANPDAPVLALQGDGGTMFTVAELATAAQLNLALPVVIVDNGGYGEIRAEMIERGDPVHAVALGHPDFSALARSLGCHGVHVTDPDHLTAEITAAFSRQQPTVIHVPWSDG